MFVTAIFAAIVAVYWPTFYTLMDLAPTRADGYTHRTVVLPVFLVLLWSQRYELAALPVRSIWWGIAGLAGAGVVWLAGALVFTRVLTDLAVIAMVPMAVLAILGTRWLAALMFPLAFLLFAVPAEGPLVPSLVNWTAAVTFASIQASGVPIYREGAYFMIPSGGWSIADACSGIAYLTTCLMLGALYAWTMYQSTLKRVVFFIGVVIIGVVGNWIRAYLTIMIAHISDNRFFRDGHGTFGWVLFAIFLFGYGWLGWRFRENSNENIQVGDKACELNRTESSRRQVIVVAILAFASLATWPLLGIALARSAQAPIRDIADIAPQRGWSRVENRSVEWTPALTNPTRERVQSFQKNGSQVEVFIGNFQKQAWDSKLVTSVNRFVDSENPNWSLAERGIAHAEISGKPLNPKTGVILGRGVRILAWQWYWINGVFEGSDTKAKAQQLLARIGGRSDASAWIAIYTKTNLSTDAGISVLEEFARDMGDSIDRALIM